MYRGIRESHRTQRTQAEDLGTSGGFRDSDEAVVEAGFPAGAGRPAPSRRYDVQPPRPQSAPSPNSSGFSLGSYAPSAGHSAQEDAVAGGYGDPCNVDYGSEDLLPQAAMPMAPQRSPFKVR